MSHGSMADHAGHILEVRRVANQIGHPVAVLADLPGPKFRLGEIAEGARRLEEGAAVELAARPGEPAVLPVRNPELLRALRPGETVFLADGAIELRVMSCTGERVSCEVLIGGTVSSGSGINVPESELGALVPTADDRRLLAFALEQGVEWVGVSFVQSAVDIASVRSCFGTSGRAKLMAKIEKRRALADLDAIITAADGVMVARGDLGVETDLAQIPLVQKRIIAAANAQARPVVTATQMLESMIEHEHPTRAEVTDVANAVLDGTDAVMLSGETAIGRHPVAAVEILDRVLRATEAEHARSRAEPPAPTNRADAMSLAACQLATRLGARAIVAAGQDFEAAASMARFRPEAPLVVLTDSSRLARELTVLRGVAPLHLPGGAPDARACLPQVCEWLYARSLARPGDRAVLLYAASGALGEADTVQSVLLP
jgi:pyruvate kinase